MLLVATVAGAGWPEAACTHPLRTAAGPAPAARPVTGKITAQEDGTPLIGVSVVLKGTTTGTATDANGEFALIVPDEGGVLVLSYVGYVTQEVAIGSQTRVSVALAPSSQSLEQVVVIGYGTVKKSDITGSVVSVSAADLKAVPTTSFDQALQGRAAGVQVTQASGTPGGGTNIRIRGTSSVNASSEPLYVIDGVLINSNANELTVGGRGPALNPLASINPSDIESLEVLKDASATAIYGSRGANGVVLVTTRHGREGKGTVNLETYYGVQQVAHKLKLLDAGQFANLVNEANTNVGRTPVYTNPAALGAGTDWQAELFRPAPIANYQASFTGGSAKTHYAVGGGYFTQKGIVIGSDFNRYSFRSNLDTDVSDRLTVGTNLSYNRLESNGVLTGPGTIVPGVISEALQFNPIAPVYDPTQPGGYTYEHLLKTNVGNPVAEAREYQSPTLTSRLLGNVYGQFRLLDGLVLRNSFGIDALTTKANTFGPAFLKRAQGSRGEASVATLEALTWINTATLTYTKKLSEASNLNVVAGFETQQFHNESLVAVAFDFPDPRSGWHNLSAAQNPQPPSNGELSWSILSYFGRANYSLRDRYLFTLSGRVDGSSKFAAGQKYGFFPSGAFAWRVSEEDFLKQSTFISNLKLRLSYGRTGNQSIPPYQSLALIAPFGEGVLNGPNGQVVIIRGQEPVNFPNSQLKWETTSQANAGVDLGVLQGRVALTAEVYLKKTYDLLLNTPIPYTTGFANTLLNVGNVQNKGLDLALNTTNLDNAAHTLSWKSTLNVSFNRNQITNLANDGDVNLGFGGNILRTGQPIGTFYGYVFDGIFQSNDEAKAGPVLVGQSPVAGDRRYRDLSGPNGTPDGIINDYDRTIIGSAQPKFTWGFNNELHVHDFTLSFFFQGSQGNQLVNLNLLNLENLNGQQNVLAEAWNERWTPTNPSNRFARASATSTDNVFSSRFVEDASYIRLKNLTLSYNLPGAALKPLRMSNARLYVSGTNLWTGTRYRGYDPEANAYSYTTNLVGVDDGTYPQARTYTVGLNVAF